eukprot:gene16027-7372_t
MAPVDLRLDGFGLLSTIFVIIVTVICKFILKLGEKCEKPQIYVSEAGKTSKLALERCRKLKEPYKPTSLWGKNGHIQTIIHAAIGRAGKPGLLKSRLHTLYASDGATVTYNYYSKNQCAATSNKIDITILRKKEGNYAERIKSDKENIVLIVPGIANSSKTVYIQAFTEILLDNGFDIAVFNHLGAHPIVKLTSPRIFTYGCTADLHLVVKDLNERFPRRKLIGIGFSMGGNVLLKYLGEQPVRQKFFSFALSICQGYDVVKASPLMMEWKGLRRFYNWLITRNYKKLITQRHRKSFLEFERKGSFERLDWRKISSSSSLQELDSTVIRPLLHQINNIGSPTGTPPFAKRHRTPPYAMGTPTGTLRQKVRQWHRSQHEQ